MAGAARTSPSSSRGRAGVGVNGRFAPPSTSTNIITTVAKYLSIEPDRIIGPSKERTIGKARGLVCYWAVRELGMAMTEVAKFLKIALPTAGTAVIKGEKLA